MPPDTPNQQTAPASPAAVRDSLRHLFGLLGVRANVQVTTFGVNQAIAFSPLWIDDADKLAQALSRVSELRPYVAHGGPTGKATPQ